MKAMLIRRYGGPEVFEAGEVPAPRPGPDEVLVHVRGSSVNPVDTAIRSGMLRFFIRLRMPAVLGVDVAGEVVERGEGATRFANGDRVFAYTGLSRPGDHFVDDFAGAARDYPEFCGGFHGLNLRSISRAASLRSRARPARSASTSASHSYKCGSRSAARGADLYRGSSPSPRAVPWGCGHTGGRSPPANWTLNGGAAYEVGTPRVTPLHSAGKT